MRRRKGQRGAAAVETAISMIFIIPIFMYGIFIDDLLRYGLDLQEAVLSTPWDFTTQNYMTAPSTGDVQHNARLMYCDHESGIDSFQGGRPDDCSGEDHHTSMVSHVCWLNGNAQQVACSGPDSSVGALSDGLASTFAGKYQTGGMYQCSGREIVENYLLPNGFLQEANGGFSQVEMTKANWKGGDGDDEGVGGGGIHGNAQSGSNATAYYLPWERSAILTDSWAINTDQNCQPDQKGGGDLYQRMKTLYSENSASSAFEGAATGFIDSLYAELLGDAPSADEVTEPNMSVTTTMPPSQSISQEGSSASYFNVPWKDWESDESKETHRKRKDFYMGCPDGSEAC